MGLYRYQFSGVIATPVSVKKHTFFSNKTISLEDAYQLIFDNLSMLALDKNAIKLLKKDFVSLASICTPDIIYGHTYNNETGIAKEVLYGQSPTSIEYNDQQIETLKNTFNTKKQQVEILSSIVLNQPIVFPLEYKENFEYWY